MHLWCRGDSYFRRFIRKRGLRADPAKVKAIVERPISENQKGFGSVLALPINYKI